MSLSEGTARSAIREASDRFEANFRARDARALVADYYVTDPMMSAPDMPVLRGRLAIQALFETIMESVTDCRLEQVEVVERGEIAYEIGRARLTMRDPAAAVTDCRYMIVWQHSPDGWRVEADFFAYGGIT